jgi:Uma2 family endonuclease
MPASRLELMTADQLRSIDVPGKWTELVRGRLVVREPPGTYHGRISATLVWLMESFVREHRLGATYAQDTGFKIFSNPDTVRAPDAAFVSWNRLSSIPTSGYAAIAPDLVAEVVSPDDRRGELLAKVGDWLDAGVRLVWVIDPGRKEVHVHRPDGSISILGVSDVVDGEDTLPGFHFTVSDLLERPADEAIA